MLHTCNVCTAIYRSKACVWYVSIKHTSCIYVVVQFVSVLLKVGKALNDFVFKILWMPVTVIIQLQLYTADRIHTKISSCGDYLMPCTPKMQFSPDNLRIDTRLSLANPQIIYSLENKHETQKLVHFQVPAVSFQGCIKAIPSAVFLHPWFDGLMVPFVYSRFFPFWKGKVLRIIGLFTGI